MAVSAIEAARDVLDRAEALLALSTSESLVHNDVRRMAWAMGSAAIDTYFHWRVRTVSLKEQLPKLLRQVEIPFGDLVDGGKKSVSARRKDIDDRPTVRARNTLHNVILARTFQSSRGIETALAMVGVTKPWATLSLVLGERVDDLKARVNGIAKRRNYIVHEGDIERQSRPQKVKRSELTAAVVADQLKWIRTFLEAVDAHLR
jgi:hypothetical protein